MATSMLDVQALLHPISPETPEGEWLRYSELYDEIQEARRADDPTLPQGIWRHELKRAEWEKVAALCEEAIRNRSKDLYLAIWLVEAWFHRHGLAGVRAGMELLEGLCHNFWEELYPRIDPFDADVRAAPFEWLNEKLPIAFASLVICQPESAEARAYSWGQLLSARNRTAPPKKPASNRRGASEPQQLTSERVQMSVALTPVSWLRDFATELDGAHAATTRLIALLQERSPAAPPSVRRIEESLHKMQRWIHAVLAERPEPMIEMQSIDPQLDGTGPTRPEEASVAASPATGAVQSREEAYRLLALAADYLLRTEPHSPTPYLVRRAVNWGKMPLAELLEEYSQDGNDLRMLRLLLGIVEGGRG